MSIQQKQANFFKMVQAMDSNMTAGKAGRLWKVMYHDSL